MNAPPLMARPCVLIPYDRAEAVSVPEAARIAGRTKMTLRTWANLYDLGRVIGGRWEISRVALAMFLDNDRAALRGYLAGDRESEIVLVYFRRCGLSPQESEGK